jgi:membrane protein DedA with SNARE-associated domain
MLHFFAHVIERYGYAAVALLVTIEGLGIPLPGETAVVTAAAFSATGTLNPLGVALAAAVGTVLGGSGGYWIGRWRGNALLERYGHWVGLGERNVRRAEWYFTKHGVKTVFFARFVALLRVLGSLLAGIMRMPFAKFSIVNLAGGLLWAATFTTLGSLFGENLPLLHHHLRQASLVGTVIILIAFAVYGARRYAARVQARADASRADASQ